MRIYKMLFLLATAACCMSLTSCVHLAKADADEECVFVKRPWFFGHGGVEMEPMSSGSTWCVSSTDEVLFKITPQKYEEVLDDIISNENTPLDFKTNITLQIIQGKSPVLLKGYGLDWYKNNVKETYCNMTRHYVSQYSPFDLTSNREVIAKIDSMVKRDMVNYIAELSKKTEFPVRVVSVITGRAIPNAKQLDEMNNTAAQIQAKITQDRRKEMEEARESAERQRAISDKAYQDEMGLTSAQFIQLKAWDIIDKKKGANIDVLFNAEGTDKIWNVRR
ncbi:SPFH domain-containing protein [Bacteroides fragilis]|uniref:SPFH domain-containing protein n=1 Tax=Bacteroides fragilis TaxID=817 RepID=UPI00202F80FE|nr:SPFH domain-containing protein [Bacteroides fragilis]MCM0236707.1 SPFH domain-containing protein [Bacteroides fragilis]